MIKEKLNILQVTILFMLSENNSTDEVSGFAIDEILEKLDNAYLYDTVYRACKKMLNKNFLAEGLKSERKKTYYVTDEGLSMIDKSQ